MGQLFKEWFPHLSRAQIQVLVFWVRKVGHVLAYAVLTLLITYASKGTPRLKRRAALWGAVGAALVALADEYLQMGLQHRSGTLQDVAVDGAGIGLAVLCWNLMGLRRSRSTADRRDNCAEDEQR